MSNSTCESCGGEIIDRDDQWGDIQIHSLDGCIVRWAEVMASNYQAQRARRVSTFKDLSAIYDALCEIDYNSHTADWADTLSRVKAVLHDMVNEYEMTT